MARCYPGSFRANSNHNQPITASRVPNNPNNKNSTQILLCLEIWVYCHSCYLHFYCCVVICYYALFLMLLHFPHNLWLISILSDENQTKIFSLFLCVGNLFTGSVLLAKWYNWTRLLLMAFRIVFLYKNSYKQFRLMRTSDSGQENLQVSVLRLCLHEFGYRCCAFY